MCRAMDSDPEIHEQLSEKQLRKHLAAAVRNIQWSYAIFWSISPRQPGILVWSDGYYNGDIKTRKIIQPIELKADQMELQRSKQLRELYESLSAGDNNQQTRRASASLSPEDLTDTEWYYLVCMTFTFTPGQRLPGKALANNEHIWLNNAQFADSKIFSRSLLAKSASIQTVVCIPLMGGVLELGTTESIMEDPALINQIRNFFWELPIPVFSEQSLSSSLQIAENDEDILCPNLDDDDMDDSMSSKEHNLLVDHCRTPLGSDPMHSQFNLGSYLPTEQPEIIIQDKVEEQNITTTPDGSSNVCCLTQQLEDLLGTPSQKFTKDEFSNSLHCPLNSNEYLSMSLINAQRAVSSAKRETKRNQVLSSHLDQGNCNELISLDLHCDDSHYAKTVATILQNSKELEPLLFFLKVSPKSSFLIWKKGFNTQKLFTSTPQKLLKKILLDRAWTCGDNSPKRQEENKLQKKVRKSEGDTHVLSNWRSEKLNEKFLLLRSLIPPVCKVDKASILGDTAEYLKHLERRVQELESCLGSAELGTTDHGRKHLDVAERTSDNYVNRERADGKKPSANKRKARDIDDEPAAEHRLLLSKDGPIDVNVAMKEKEVLVEMHCPWREYLLLEIVESISSLHLDPLSVQSSVAGGKLALTIKSKLKSSIVASPGMIKRSLQGVISKCL
ncbi:hypothetical protein Cni_G18867 [Canna indica]|uniref:BHLH domain-containing protein n=1 Tax=Canna indica TaxID=4628 RepID=A0AAQ3KJM5_9LILI|nr:hypothetical protein Cni_G18867 [Canna indica]